MLITPAHPRTLHSPQNICSAHHPIITTLLQPTPTSSQYPTPPLSSIIMPAPHYHIQLTPFPKHLPAPVPIIPSPPFYTPHLHLSQTSQSLCNILTSTPPNYPTICLHHPHFHPSPSFHLTPPQNLDLHLSLLPLFPPFYTPPPTTSPSPPLYITPCLFNHASPPLHHSTPSQHPHLHLPVTPPSPPIYITPPPTLPFPPLLSTFISIPSPSSHLQLPSTSISISSPLAPSSFCNHFF